MSAKQLLKKMKKGQKFIVILPTDNGHEVVASSALRHESVVDILRQVAGR